MREEGKGKNEEVRKRFAKAKRHHTYSPFSLPFSLKYNPNTPHLAQSP